MGLPSVGDGSMASLNDGMPDGWMEDSPVGWLDADGIREGDAEGMADAGKAERRKPTTDSLSGTNSCSTTDDRVGGNKSHDEKECFH